MLCKKHNLKQRKGALADDYLFSFQFSDLGIDKNQKKGKKPGTLSDNVNYSL